MEGYHLLIWNAEDPIIKSKIESFGYTTEKIDESKALYEEVVALAENQRKEYGEQYAVSSQFPEQKQEAEGKINTLRKYGRYAFRNIPDAHKILNLSKRMPFFPTGYILQCIFMKDYPKDKIGLQSLLHLVYNLRISLIILQILVISKTYRNYVNVKQVMHRGLPKYEMLKFDELKNWCSELRDLSKVIFEDEDSQYLEKLGILVRS